MKDNNIAFIITNRRPLGPFLSIDNLLITRDQTALIETNYASGIPASRKIAVLRREDPSINIIFKRDIYNTTADLSRAKRQRKSPPEALIDRLETEKAEGKTHIEWRRDAEGHIAMLFIDLLPCKSMPAESRKSGAGGWPVTQGGVIVSRP